MNLGSLRRETVICGLGHIGASLAAALADRGWTIWGWDANPAATRFCRKKGWLQGQPGSPIEARSNSLVCVLAIPESAVRDPKLKSMLAKLPSSSIVTDVFSSKGEAVAQARELCGELNLRYGWSHPLAGREGSGAASADPTIFAGAKVLVDSEASTAVRAELGRFWKAAGCAVEHVTTEEHQRRMAAGSHLMHVLAFSLMHSIGGESAATPSVLGATRVAKSDPEAWADILMSNRVDVADSVERLRGELKKAARMLRAGRGRALRQYLLEGQRLRLELEGRG